MSVAVGVLLLLTATILGVVATRGSCHVAAWLRRAACGLTLAVALILTRPTVTDSGAAAGYLLGIPAVLVLAVILSDVARRGVLLVSAAVSMLMIAWALLLVLGVGLMFFPPALLLLASVGLEARSTRTASVPAENPVFAVISSVDA